MSLQRPVVSRTRTRRRNFAGILLTIAGASACSLDSPTQVTGPSATPVTDLTVEASSGSTLTVRWTQVDDGAGRPARYSLRYGTPPLSWSAGTAACEATLGGTEVGAPLSCTIEGLEPGARYDVQVMSTGTANGVEHAAYSKVLEASTPLEAKVASLGRTMGIWVSRETIMRRPTSGTPWRRLLEDAQRDPGRANIANQDSNHDVYTLAAAFVCVRTDRYCDKARRGVLSAIGTEKGARWLAAGNNLGAYVVAADVLGLRNDGDYDSPGSRVHRWIASWMDKRLRDNNTDDMRRIRPFGSGANADAHEGFIFAAIAAYLGNDRALERAWDAFRTYACVPDAPDNENIHLGRIVKDGWAHDNRRPCAVNPEGSRKTVPDGRSGEGNTYRLDGSLGADMRRGGSYKFRPGYTGYPWIGLAGFVPAAVILHRAGDPAFKVADQAVLRTHEYMWWLRERSGDGRWFDGRRGKETIQLVNVVYDKSFPVADGDSSPARTVGYTNWTHSTW